MKRRIVRLALTIVLTLVACGASAAAASAALGPATAATMPASHVTQISATLVGVIQTNDNQVTAWQFEYGTSPNYDKFTPVHTITGQQRTVTVSAPVSALKPGTVYHFQVLALTSVALTSSFYQLVPSPGGDFTFKTRPATRGRLLLLNRAVVVKRNRTVFVFLRCARTSPGTNPCNGRVSIVAHARSGATIGCGHASFAINPAHTKRIFVRATNACVGLLQSTPSHRLAGTVPAATGGRIRLRKRVTLILG